MKTLLSVLAGLAIGSVCLAQTVTINTTGNRNKQILVDNQTYTINNATTSATQAVVVNDLTVGQHTLTIVRNNQNNRSTSNKTTFTIREGYDLTISVSANGSVSTSEQRIAGKRGGARGQMNATAYNRLYNQTRAKVSASQRAAYLETELSNTNKKLTATQASQLIKLVNSESLRLSLAKQSYAKVSDPQNFSLVANLLTSTSSRNDLSNYINSIDTDGDVTVDKVAMTEADYNTIYRKVRLTFGLGAKYSTLTDIFNTETNYFTVAQAKQLITLVSSESNRLELAKSSYNNITDPANFSQMYDMFSSQSNKNALAAYVSSNAYNY